VEMFGWVEREKGFSTHPERDDGGKKEESESSKEPRNL